MKRILRILTISMAMLTFCPVQAPAQGAARAMQKVVKIFKKTPKAKTGGVKAVKKTGSGARSVSAHTCPTCSGAGTLRSWNSYTNQYQTSKCNRCYGKGVIYIRH